MAVDDDPSELAFDWSTASRPLSPSAARRRLGAELRALRESASLSIGYAGSAIDRSAATIVRIESGKTAPRLIDVVSLLEEYYRRSPGAISPEVRERILQLASIARRTHWFDPFKDDLTGEPDLAHYARLAEYEADATEIRSFAPDLIPAAVQTQDYASQAAQLLFPAIPRTRLAGFVDFQLARQRLLAEPSQNPRFVGIVSDIALRRILGGAETQIRQLRSLLDDIAGRRPAVVIRVISSSVAIPAALGGPFTIHSFGNAPGSEGDLVYLETRSGGDYLRDGPSSERYKKYFDDLMENSLSRQDSIDLVEEIIRENEERDTSAKDESELVGGVTAREAEMSLSRTSESWKTHDGLRDLTGDDLLGAHGRLLRINGAVWISGSYREGQELFRTLEQFCSALGIIITPYGPEGRGSWWQRFSVKAQELFSADELAEKLESAELGVKAHLVDKQVAENDLTKAETASKLDKLLEDVEEGVIILGQLVIVKYENKKLIKSIDPLTAARIERSHHLLSDPYAVIELLTGRSQDGTGPDSLPPAGEL